MISRLKLSFVFGVLSLLGLILPSLAHAGTLTFDDISCNGTQVPSGYGGLNWNNMYCLNASTEPPSGYQNGMVSSPNVAYNAFGNTAVVSDTSFTLNSAYFTGAWNDGLNITVTGYDSGHVQIDTTTFVVNTSGPTFETFNWTGLAELDFSSFGGTPHGYNGQGTQFVLDNMTINQPVGAADPSSTLLLSINLLGAALVGLAWKLRRPRASLSCGEARAA
jgi:hypothetical protein